MTVGDIINQIDATGGFNYQPASGVEVMVTAVLGTTHAVNLIDGTNTALFGTLTATDLPSVRTCKLGITNTNYLQLSNVAAVSGFTGVQTK